MPSGAQMNNKTMHYIKGASTLIAYMEESYVPRINAAVMISRIKYWFL